RALARNFLAARLPRRPRKIGHLDVARPRARQLADRFVAFGEAEARAHRGIEAEALLELGARLIVFPAAHQLEPLVEKNLSRGLVGDRGRGEGGTRPECAGEHEGKGGEAAAHQNRELPNGSAKADGRGWAGRGRRTSEGARGTRDGARRASAEDGGMACASA